MAHGGSSTSGGPIPATTPLGTGTGQRDTGDRSPASARTGTAARAGPPTNLPPEATSFVGRERELDELARLVGRVRLLTLAGTGGSGKTRLALRAAAAAAPSFRDGTWWVDLAALTDPDLVPERIAGSLGVPEVPGRRSTELLTEHLRTRRALLVLDNCEHLVETCALLTDTLLRECADVRVLATSREPLGISGEVTWSVPPLALPDPLDAGSPAALRRSAAIRLFVERAHAASHDFDLTDANAAAVARLCARLDGMPLAIELAASRTKVLAAEQILERLDDRFRLLTDHSRTAVGRHRTLRATMDWSHELLSEPERAVFRRLSVFAGGCGVDAAEQVCQGDGVSEGDVLDLLSCLVDKSLVVATHGLAPGEVRFTMLETVRQYAAERLEHAGEADTARARHADVYLELATAAEPRLSGPAQQPWLEHLEREHDNLAAALSWLLDRADARRGLRLAGALGRFWWFRGHFAEGAAWLEAFLRLPEAHAAPAERAAALHALGLATFWHESTAAGVEVSRARFEEAAGLYRELADVPRLAAVLRDLGGYWKGTGDAATARAVLGESLTLSRQLDDAFGIGAATAYLGIVTAYQGDTDGARALLEDGVALLRGCGGPDEVMRCMFFLACLACDASDAAAARARFEELMGLGPLRALPYAAGFALDGLARLAAAEGDDDGAVRLWAAARQTHARIGTAAGPAYDDYVRRGLEPARRALGAQRERAAAKEGRAMTFEQATAFALRPAPRAATAGTADATSMLSARETEVLRLVADGLSDAEIAGSLHLSRRTVSNHLGSTYRKLGVGSRTAALKRARDLDLL